MQSKGKRRKRKIIRELIRFAFTFVITVAVFALTWILTNFDAVRVFGVASALSAVICIILN